VRVEKALRESEERYRSLVELSPDAVVVYVNGIIVFANLAAATLARAESPTQLIGMPLARFIHPDYREIVRERVRAILERGERATLLEEKLVLLDNSVIDVEVAGAGLIYNGQPAIQVIARDISERKKVETALRQRTLELEALNQERARLLEEVQHSHQQLETFSQRLLQVQETERRELARELHDEIGQQLTALKYTLSRVDKLRDAADQAAISESLGILDDLTARVHSLSLDLRPPNLDAFGLQSTLTWLVERFSQRTGIRVDLAARGLERRFTPEIEITAYRIVQESLTNVARHAQVDQVQVRGRVRQNRLQLTIEDRGVGFDPDERLSKHATIGLAGMRERAARLNGSVRIKSKPQHGTRITVELPLNAAPLPTST
jgi:PAS domain S-box-containing protein